MNYGVELLGLCVRSAVGLGPYSYSFTLYRKITIPTSEELGHPLPDGPIWTSVGELANIKSCEELFEKRGGRVAIIVQKGTGKDSKCLSN